MNARQRRLVRRAVVRIEAHDIAEMLGHPDIPPPPPRVTRAVRALYLRAPVNVTGRPTRWWFKTRRHKEAYGHRCACGRKAHVFHPNAHPAPLYLCAICDREVPF